MIGPPERRDRRECYAGRFSARGLAQGFNPGNRHPDQYALKGRQIQRTNNVKAESNRCTPRLRI
jgi:hypothetical protein